MDYQENRVTIVDSVTEQKRIMKRHNSKIKVTKKFLANPHKEYVSDQVCGRITRKITDTPRSDDNASDTQPDEERDTQEKDKSICKLLEWKETSNIRPQWSEISLKSAKLKSYWSQWERLEVKDGILHVDVDDGKHQRW